MSDTTASFTSDDLLFESRTFTFDAKHIFAPGGAGGAQTLVVQWRALQGKAYMGDRSLAVYVENLTDDLYYDGGGSGGSPNNPYVQLDFGPSRPRTAGLRFIWEF